MEAVQLYTAAALKCTQRPAQHSNWSTSVVWQCGLAHTQELEVTVNWPRTQSLFAFSLSFGEKGRMEPCDFGWLKPSISIHSLSILWLCHFRVSVPKGFVVTVFSPYAFVLAHWPPGSCIRSDPWIPSFVPVSTGFHCPLCWSADKGSYCRINYATIWLVPHHFVRWKSVALTSNVIQPNYSPKMDLEFGLQ